MTQDSADNTSLQNELKSTTHLLTDIDNVPELSSVTAIQALSYLNQSLENLILVYQSTSAVRNSNEMNDLLGLTSSSFDPSDLNNTENDTTNDNPDNNIENPIEPCSTRDDPATTGNNSNKETKNSVENQQEGPNNAAPADSSNTQPNDSANNHNDESAPTMTKAASPQTESENESMISLPSKTSSYSSSNSSLVNTIKAATISCYANKDLDSTIISANNSNSSSRSNSNGSDETPHLMPELAPKPSADPSSILEEAAVVAAVLIEGTEQRRRSSGVLIPMESRIKLSPTRVSQLTADNGAIATNQESNTEINKQETDNENNLQDSNSSLSDTNKNDKPESSEIAVIDSDSSGTASPIVSPSTMHQQSSSTLARPAVSIQEMEEKGQIIKRFWSKKAPAISIWNYLLRIHKFSPMSTSVYLSASLYIYRLCIELRTILMTPLSVHRIILASLRVACKNIEDVTYKQARFAATGGVRPADLYRLEIAFLFLIDFDVCIKRNVLQEHLVMLTELDIQANRHRRLLGRKRQRSFGSEDEK